MTGRMIRRSYAAAGWHLWRCPGFLGPLHEPAELYYAATPRGRMPGAGETLWSDSPLGTLRKVLAHPSMRPA